MVVGAFGACWAFVAFGALLYFGPSWPSVLSVSSVSSELSVPSVPSGCSGGFQDLRWAFGAFLVFVCFLCFRGFHWGFRGPRGFRCLRGFLCFLCLRVLSVPPGPLVAFGAFGCILVFRVHSRPSEQLLLDHSLAIARREKKVRLINCHFWLWGDRLLWQCDFGARAPLAPQAHTHPMWHGVNLWVYPWVVSRVCKRGRPRGCLGWA